VSKWKIIQGDCVEVLRTLPEGSVPAIVCDPPYGLEFMGKEWDRLGEALDDRLAQRSRAMQDWHYAWAVEALRVLIPGGHLLAFGGTRTYHRLTCALEDAGFEIRDTLAWLYGSGFPKSMDVSKAIDKAARGVPQGGADPTSPNHGKFKTQATEGKRGEGDGGRGYGAGPGQFMKVGDIDPKTAEISGDPATPEAEQWQGWGTALKPAHEPIVMARKPLGEKTVAKNVLKHGTGAINIDATRVGPRDRTEYGLGGSTRSKGVAYGTPSTSADFDASQGRWPANVVLSHSEDCVEVGTRKVKSGTAGPKSGGIGAALVYSPSRTNEEGIGESQTFADADGTETVPLYKCVEDCPVRMLDEQSGVSKSTGGRNANISKTSKIYGGGKGLGQDLDADAVRGDPGFGDIGGASRFFYCAKASKKDRGANNKHPTVKPIALMQWLVRLVTPPGGFVLDIFSGSGTTGVAAVREGFDFLGIERESEYVGYARERLLDEVLTEEVFSESSNA
jgi:DNA modification methylase